MAGKVVACRVEADEARCVNAALGRARPGLLWQSCCCMASRAPSCRGRRVEFRYVCASQGMACRGSLVGASRVWARRHVASHGRHARARTGWGTASHSGACQVSAARSWDGAVRRVATRSVVAARLGVAWRAPSGEARHGSLGQASSAPFRDGKSRRVTDRKGGAVASWFERQVMIWHWQGSLVSFRPAWSCTGQAGHGSLVAVRPGWLRPVALGQVVARLGLARIGCCARAGLGRKRSGLVWQTRVGWLRRATARQVTAVSSRYGKGG